MDKIINDRIPHIGEQIFETIDTPSLIHCKSVAKTWKVFAENILFIRFKRNVCDVFEFEEGIQTEVFKILLEWSRENEIDFNRKKYGGFTGFLSACYNNHIEVVKMLVENSQKLGIDLNVQDSDGYSGLMRACHEENEEVVDFLLANSENYNIKLDLRNKGD